MRPVMLVQVINADHSKHSNKSNSKSSKLYSLLRQCAGMALALGGGILYGLYSAGWNVACNDTFNVARPGKLPLTLFLLQLTDKRNTACQLHA